MMRISILFLVLALSFTFSTFAQSSSPAQTQGWRQTQTTNSNAATRFVLSGKFLKGPTSEITNRPALAVDCGAGKKSRGSEGRFVAGHLLVGATLKIDYVEPSEIHGTSYYQKIRVVYRLDEGKEEKDIWDPGKDKTSALFPKDALKKMLRAHTVQITVKDEGETDLVMQFDVPDSSTVEQACDVDYKK